MGELVDILRAVRRERDAWRRDRRDLGFKHSVLRRFRFHAGSEAIVGRVEELVPRLTTMEAEAATLGTLATGLAGSVDALAARLAAVDDLVATRLATVDTELVPRLSTAEAELVTTRAELVATRAELDATRIALEGVRALVAEHDRAQRVTTVMGWIAQAAVAEDTLVSVVLPTRDRAALVPTAVRSILDQSYSAWELVIVDDASTDDTAAVLASLDDPRVRVLRGEGRGAGAARNVALAHAKGELIAYADDDNTMHADWLKAVVWGFAQRPDVDVLYGAFVVDDVRRVLNTDSGALPQLFFRDYDHAGLAQHNIADMGAMAHRAGLQEARFDEDLREMADWDLLLRLTRNGPPLALPAIACYYTSDAPNRLTNGPTHLRDLERVRNRNRR